MDNFNNQGYNNGFNDNVTTNVKAFSILAYFNLLFLVGLLVHPENKNPLVRHHVNNGVLLSIASYVAAFFIKVIPFFGFLIGSALYLVITILAIIGIVNAANGKRFDIPVLSDIKIVK